MSENLKTYRFSKWINNEIFILVMLKILLNPRSGETGTTLNATRTTLNATRTNISS